MRQYSKLLLVVWLVTNLTGTAKFQNESTQSFQEDTIASIDSEMVEETFSTGLLIVPTESIALYQDTAMEELVPSTAGIDEMDEVIPSTEGIDTIEEVVPFTDNIDIASYSSSIPTSIVDSIVYTMATQTITEFSYEISESIAPTVLLPSTSQLQITSFTDNSPAFLSLVGSTDLRQSSEKLQSSFSTISTIPQTEASSTGVIPNSNPPLTTSNTGSEGRGLLDRLKDAPLWVWVAVAIACLSIISCCFLLCSVAACMARKKDRKKDKQNLKKAKERRKRSLKMRKIYGELEEENTDKKKNKKSASDNTQKSSFSRWDSFRSSWSRRNSMKATSTFKPQLTQMQEVTNSSEEANSSIPYTKAPHSMTLPNSNTTSSFATTSNDIHQPSTRRSTGTFTNPTFEVDEEEEHQQQGASKDGSADEPLSNIAENSNPYW